MKQILIVGAGKIGAVIADLLSATGDYAVTLADSQEQALTPLRNDASPVELTVLDARDQAALSDLLGGKFALINGSPFGLSVHAGRALAKNQSDE